MVRSIYNWTPRISPQKIKRLYESDASGMLDIKLLDEIGFSIYMRCLEGQEVMEAVHQLRVKCRKCESILYRQYHHNAEELLSCKCGWETTWGAYRKSTFAQNMCNGNADPFFLEYITKWEKVRSNSEKMILIDWLIHQFHVQDQIPGRAVGVNIIAGTNKQVADLIIDLAYGENSIAAIEQKDTYLKGAQDWRRKIITKFGGNNATRKIGTKLGIVGSSNMPMNKLLDYIAEVDTVSLKEMLKE